MYIRGLDSEELNKPLFQLIQSIITLRFLPSGPLNVNIVYHQRIPSNIVFPIKRGHLQKLHRFPQKYFL